MQPGDELDALGRIISAVKGYYRQTTNVPKPVNAELIDAYLKQHLSIQDWVFWKRLQAEGHTDLVYPQGVVRPKSDRDDTDKI